MDPMEPSVVAADGHELTASRRVAWLAAVIRGYQHYPETFGEDWTRILAESLTCHLWPNG